MKIQLSNRHASQTGYTLITTMVIALAASVLLAGTLSRTFSNTKLNDRNNAYICGTAAAEAATEKVMAQMMVDFATGGLTLITNNLSHYQTGMLPSTNENSYWANFVFSDGQGNKNAIYVAQTTTNANPPYVALETQYPGLNAFASTYRILANTALVTNTSSFNHYNFTNAVCQDVQMAEIPVFQFAIFYNSLLEFTDCAPLTINGRVQCNSNVYVGCPSSGSTLTFNYLVSVSGIITNPAWFGYAQSSYLSNNITYNGTPVPGYATGGPVLTLPMGAATNTPAAIIQLPTGTELTSPSATNALSLQRYYFKADLVILVTNTTPTNVAVSVTFKSSMFDSGTTVSYTNYSYAASTNAATSNGIYVMNTNWAWWFGSTNSLGAGSGWLTTNATFFDSRQNQTNLVTQIDVGKFGTWIATNTNCLAKWNSSSPFNGVVYVADLRTTNSLYMDCVRLTNGQYIPTIGASNVLTGVGTNTTTNSAYAIPGLSVGTINPLYIAGLYNCPSNINVGATNTSGTSPCSVICDAITILSPNWADGNSWAEVSGGSVPTASSSDTVNTAIIAGNVPSTGSSNTQFSGGVHNLTRLLENWGSSSLWLNTSIINLYPSAQATVQFLGPSTYYSAPTRHFSFDLNFTSSAGLPPGTPQVNRLIRADWFNPPPGPTGITNNPSPTLSFVPQ